jgi:hypothetical protein
MKEAKIKRKERKRLEKLVWKAAKKSKATPFDVADSVISALRLIREGF